MDDNKLDAEREIDALRGAGLAIEERVVWTEPDYRRALAEFQPEVVLSGFSFQNFDGATALAILTAEYPSIPLIFVSGILSEERLVIAVQNGAADYVLKTNLLRLPGAVVRALSQAEEKRLLLEAQIRVARLSSVRDVMSAVNAAIARLLGRARLFEEACRIATDIGRFTVAAIVTREDTVSKLTVEAFAGLPVRPIFENWLNNLSPELDGRAAGTLTETFLGNAAVVVNDLSEDLSIGARRELWNAGVRSVGSFPLLVDGAVLGALILTSNELGYFDDEEIKLVSEMASNLSLSLGLIMKQQRVLRLSRIRDVLSAVNEAIVRETDSEQLYHEATRVAFETAGYVNVYVLLVADVRKPLRLAAVVGKWNRDAAEFERVLQHHEKLGRGPVVQALRTRKPAVVQELLRDTSLLSPVRSKLLADGIRGVGVFPLVVAGRCVGAMGFNTAEAGYFDDEEVGLLTNLTSNLSFALDRIERQERLARTGRIRDALSALNVAIVRLRDNSELCQEACRIAVEVGGFANAMLAEVDPESSRIALPFFLGRSERSAFAEALVSGPLGGAPGIIENSIRSLRPAVQNDVQNVECSPHYERHVADGIRATASFPLVVDGRTIGALVFESEIEEFFDAEGIELLTNLTNNLGFGLSLLEKQKRVDYLSYYDAMTGLPNRTLFYDRLSRDIAACKSAGKTLALAIIDISRFSRLNNTLGEYVGDEALRKIAARLRESIDESRIARVGGDKFALSFPMIDDLTPVAAAITEEGIKLFEEPFAIGDRELHIKARAGCAVFPGDGADAQELFQNAEAALLDAKASRRTYRFYAPELNLRLAKQLDLEARLLRAIEERQFVLYYQPKLKLAGRTIVGFEGLIRWNDPQRGLVAPGEFIPLLESTGMIIPVGRWAMLEALRQFEEWRVQGLRPPRIALNLSVVQLRHDRLVEDVRSATALFESGCGLDLEVTESMLMENVGVASEKLRAIRALGPRVALDDFGTGYSSLSYLSQLPLNSLKIDQSFVHGMFDDHTKRSVVSTIISLGEAFGLTVIAEGVETESEARLLELLKCDEFQGFLFSPPVPPAEAARFLTPVDSVT